MFDCSYLADWKQSFYCVTVVACRHSGWILDTLAAAAAQMRT